MRTLPATCVCANFTEVPVSLATVLGKRIGDILARVTMTVKNINTLRHLHTAINFEINRQYEVISSGGTVINETRTCDEHGRTLSMRDKEEITDYRFMPEPNLPFLRVERIVESRVAMTHAYTVLLLFYADRFGEKLANTSHIMTKELMVDWMKSRVFHTRDIQEAYLIVDSWSSFRDIDSIKKTVPEGCQITVRNIPVGATSLIQPLDVFFFGPMKNVMERVRTCAMVSNVAFNMTQRDSTLKIISQIYRMFCAPRFSNFLKYSWYKAGYVDDHPGPFVTPGEYLFNFGTIDCFVSDCKETACVRCAVCEEHVCFAHFFRCSISVEEGLNRCSRFLYV
ncbi:unnamed protein product [Heligmosomoides polygyrus]|uniref:DDE-1 domain-containing protein n=1 Tax=Heligmosomoides polygyrus TaxID=6339 RepID=A0A3P8E6C6_HELPZ|nr:unnamed protein product [Heligmosomoides polygyrus]